MGLAQDLGLINADGELDSVTCPIAETALHQQNCQTLHGKHTKASTAYLHSRVDVINDRLCVSAEGLIFGIADPSDDRLLAALALNGPTQCMAELFVDNQGNFGGRLHFPLSVIS